MTQGQKQSELATSNNAAETLLTRKVTTPSRIATQEPTKKAGLTVLCNAARMLLGNETNREDSPCYSLPIVRLPDLRNQKECDV